MIQQKFHDDCMINPRREKGERLLPVQGFFLPNPTEARFGVEELERQGGRRRPFFHSALCVSPEDDLFVAGPGVGAPMAVICLEKLIALGAEKIVVVSCCGCLDPDRGVGDIIVPNQSLSGEGTSKYYQHENQCQPARTMVAELERFLIGTEVDFHKGIVWSTDAPYREQRSTLVELREQYGVAGVDMEFSALCSAANFRGISLAGLFVISDLLFTDKWQPGFNHKQFRHQSKTLIRKLLTGCFRKP